MLSAARIEPVRPSSNPAQSKISPISGKNRFRPDQAEEGLSQFADLEFGQAQRRIFGIAYLQDGVESDNLAFIHQDLLDKTGLAVPTTLDEFTAVAKAFKDKGLVQFPIASCVNLTTYQYSLDPVFGAFGAMSGAGGNSQWWLKNADGTLHYGSDDLCQPLPGRPDPPLYELVESAMLDGASHWKTLTAIMVPLSTPAMATIALFAFVQHWNSWFDGIVFLRDIKLWPMQSYLYQMLSTQALGSDYSGNRGVGVLWPNVSPKGAQAVMLFYAILPIVIIYPLLQRYFVTGLTIGAVKG